MARVKSLVWALLPSAAVIAATGAQTVSYPGGIPGRSYPGPQMSQAEEPKIADVNFQGGTVQEYVDYLRGIAPNNAVNVVLADEVAKTVVPAVRLRDVNVTQAVYVLQDVTDNRREMEIDSNYNSTGGGVYTIKFRRTGNPYQDSPAPIAIYQINDIITDEGKEGGKGGGLATGSLPVNTVLTALEQAMKMVGGAAPDVKYHADSGLLLMKGNQSQMEAATQVLNSLRDTTGRVNGMGGGKWQRTWALANVSAAEVVRAFRAVFPAGSAEAEAVSIESDPNTNRLIVTAPRNMAVAMDVLVRYVDRAPAVNQEVVLLEARMRGITDEKARVETQLQDAMKRMQAERDAMAAELAERQANLDQARREVLALQQSLQAAQQKK